jgi:hypothetical protein
MFTMIANRSVAASDRGNVPCPSSIGFMVAIAKLNAGSSHVVLPTVTQVLQPGETRSAI